MYGNTESLSIKKNTAINIWLYNVHNNLGVVYHILKGFTLVVCLGYSRETSDES